MRRLATNAFVVSVLAIAWPALAENPPANANLLKTVAGTWGWRDSEASGCATNPHTIAFPNEKIATFTFAKPFKSASGNMTTVSTYDVLYAEANRITMYLQGETRRTEAGDRVLWVLILQNPSTYAWRRTDWRADGKTADIVRCKS